MLPQDIALQGFLGLGLFVGDALFKTFGQIYNPVNVFFTSNSRTEMRAGEAIVLNPQFVAELGSYLNLEIDTISCSSLSRLTSLRSADDGSVFDFTFIDELQHIENFNGEDDSFHFYPNPAHQQVRIVLPQGLSGAIDLYWYNSLGQQLRIDYLETSTNTLDLGLEGLSPGLYYLHLRQGLQTWTAKLSIR